MTTPGQSGVFDLDLNWVGGGLGTKQIAEDFINVNANNTRTALRIGSSDTSGNAQTSGNIIPSTDRNTYFLGGGGGTLTITSVLTDNYNGGHTALEMGTSGQLLPGRIIPREYGQNSITGATLIRAGTLQLASATAVLHSSSLSVGTYSTGFNGVYTGAPNGKLDGPGQLLLDPNLYYLGPVNNCSLDGGAVGWTGNKTLTALPGVYGATLNSTLANPLGALTNILHLGGDYSSGTMTKTNDWIIADINGFSPVALVKSGPSVLDLSQGGANTYSGGTSILGGQIQVSDASQLGSGPIFLTNAGTLHVIGTASPTFNQTLKLYGGPLNGPGVVMVNSYLSATFTQPIDTTDATAGPQSMIEIRGGGTLNLDDANPYPNNVPNGNRWGLVLTNGTVITNQLPIDRSRTAPKPAPWWATAARCPYSRFRGSWACSPYP